VDESDGFASSGIVDDHDGIRGKDHLGDHHLVVIVSNTRKCLISYASADIGPVVM
jgi:hypothetical protein